MSRRGSGASSGPARQESGGIASVAACPATWAAPGSHQRLVPTTDGRGIVSDVALLVRAILELVRVARTGPVVVHVHLSQGGSFLQRGADRAASKATPGARPGAPARQQLPGVRHRQTAPGPPDSEASRRGGLLTHETRAIVKSLVDADAPVLLIHNALESSPPSRASTAAPSDAGVVVFAGKVGWRKGVDVLLEAWQELDARSELDGARLIICGPLDSDFSRRPDDGLTVVGDVAWSRRPR